jgi:hypothetical protein
MARVWLVTLGERHEGYRVEGVYSSESAARARSRELRQRWRNADLDEIEIEQWEINGDKFES